MFRGCFVVWLSRGVGWAGVWAGVAVGSLDVGVICVEGGVCGGGALGVRVLGGWGGNSTPPLCEGEGGGGSVYVGVVIGLTEGFLWV